MITVGVNEKTGGAIDRSDPSGRLRLLDANAVIYEVTVELRSGLRLPMIVLWVERGQTGVRFLGPIAPGHTVMRSLDQAARKYKLPCAAVHG